MCDSRGLGGSVRGMPWCPGQVSGRPVCVAGRRARLGHADLAPHPGADLVDRLTRSPVLWLSRLEEVEYVLRARCRPQSEETVIRIGEGPTAADRHETRVALFREDHNRPMSSTMLPRRFCQPGGSVGGGILSHACYTGSMAKVITQRTLRNESGEIMRGLDRGESYIVTRNGVPVGELMPVRRREAVPAEMLLAALAGAPRIDPIRFRKDVDELIDQDPRPRA